MQLASVRSLLFILNHHPGLKREMRSDSRCAFVDNPILSPPNNSVPNSALGITHRAPTLRKQRWRVPTYMYGLPHGSRARIWYSGRRNLLGDWFRRNTSLTSLPGTKGGFRTAHKACEV